jgi:hypothetical protein
MIRITAAEVLAFGLQLQVTAADDAFASPTELKKSFHPSRWASGMMESPPLALIHAHAYAHALIRATDTTPLLPNITPRSRRTPGPHPPSSVFPTHPPPHTIPPHQDATIPPLLARSPDATSQTLS